MAVMSGSQLRRHQAALAAGAAACSFCPHLVLDHLSLPRDHPDYRPLLFACRAEGCGCRFTAGSARGGADLIPSGDLPVCACGHDLARHRRRGASRCTVPACRCAGWLIQARPAQP